MILVDKTNKEVIETNIVAMEYILEGCNVCSDYSRVFVLSLEEIERMCDEMEIEDELCEKANEMFKNNIFGTEDARKYDIFVLKSLEDEKDEIFMFDSGKEAQKFAADIANEMIDNIDCEYCEREAFVVSTVRELLDYVDESDEDVSYIKDFIEKKMQIPSPASKTELADYLGVTKGAVSQYNKKKLELMLAGLGVLR